MHAVYFSALPFARAIKDRMSEDTTTSQSDSQQFLRHIYLRASRIVKRKKSGYITAKKKRTSPPSYSIYDDWKTLK